MYGYVAENKATINKLFMAGIIPGLCLTAIIIVSAIVYARKMDLGVEKGDMVGKMDLTWKAMPGALMPI